MWIEIIATILILFPSIVLHEYAHGWMANRLGDPTAKEHGRLTLNPLKHIDPVGTLLVPGILLVLMAMGINHFVFGWAKPVPVNFGRLSNPKKDMIGVALAGPAVNIILALLASQVLRLDLASMARGFFELMVFFNLLLAVFNMIPIPPLDGSRVVMGLLPNRWAFLYSRLEPYGILIVAGLLYLGLFDRLLLGIVKYLENLLGVPAV